MKIKANQVLKDFNNKPLLLDKDTELTVGMALATMLNNQQVKSELNSYKRYILSEKFYKEKEVEVDDADWTHLKKMIEEDDTFSPMVNGQILKLYND